MVKITWLGTYVPDDRKKRLLLIRKFFNTLAEAEEFANDIYDSAIEGMLFKKWYLIKKPIIMVYIS